MGCDCNRRIRKFEVKANKSVILKFNDEICEECELILRKILSSYPSISDIFIRGKRVEFRLIGDVNIEFLREELAANNFELEN